MPLDMRQESVAERFSAPPGTKGIAESMFPIGTYNFWNDMLAARGIGGPKKALTQTQLNNRTNFVSFLSGIGGNKTGERAVKFWADLASNSKEYFNRESAFGSPKTTYAPETSESIFTPSGTAASPYDKGEADNTAPSTLVVEHPGGFSVAQLLAQYGIGETWQLDWMAVRKASNLYPWGYYRDTGNYYGDYANGGGTSTSAGYPARGYMNMNVSAGGAK
jgi:hypothetical protein